MARRLFLGIMAPTSVRAEIDQHRQTWHWPPGARLTAAPDLHLTLHFLGDVDTAREVSLRVGLASVPMQPSLLRLGEPGVLPGGVALLHVIADDGLRQLHADIAQLLRELGLPVESRPWMPHLTLARKATGAQPPEQPTAIRWRARSYALVWSRSGPGARYSVIGRWPERPDSARG